MFSRGALCIFFGSSFVLRVIAALISNFERDEAEIFSRASEFFISGRPAIDGAEIVYSSTRLPGSLQDILMGLPIFLSDGRPWGSAIFIGVLSFFSAWLLSKIYIKIFPEISASWIRIFILFAPWSVVFVKLWNPTYLPFIFTLFLYGFFRVLSSKDFKKDFYGSFLMALPLTLTVQLHMSFVLLLASLGYVVIRYFSKINVAGLVMGLLLGSFTMLPWVIDKSVNAFQTSEITETAEINESELSENSEKNFITSNIVINFKNLREIPRILFRFSSFSTGETTRFFRKGGGLKRIIEVANLTPFIWPAFIFGILISAIFTVFGVSFWFKKRLWLNLFDHLREFPLFTARKNMKSTLEKSDQTQFEIEAKKLRAFFDEYLVFILVVTCLSFTFSIMGPTSHTFWILGPLSFYPLFRVLWDLKEGRLKALVFQQSFILVYSLLALSYSMILPYRSPYVAPLILSEFYADQKEYPYRFHHGVGVIRKLERMKKEATH